MKIIRVSLPDAERDRSVLTLFDDVAEELYGELTREPIAEIPDLDSNPRQFQIHVAATRHLGTVTTSLRRLLKRHGVAVERLDRAL